MCVIIPRVDVRHQMVPSGAFECAGMAVLVVFEGSSGLGCISDSCLLFV